MQSHLAAQSVETRHSYVLWRARAAVSGEAPELGNLCIFVHDFFFLPLREKME
jgi:hypothetical protein